MRLTSATLTCNDVRKLEDFFRGLIKEVLYQQQEWVMT